MNVLPPDDKKPLLPYFTARGWLAIAALIALLIVSMMAGVELHDWLMGGIAK